MRIGVCGLGKMGLAIAERLVATGANVVVWNRSLERARSTGFQLVETPRALAAQSDVVITVLKDRAAFESVYAGLVTAASGKLFIEMSTIEPESHRNIAAYVVEAGGAFIECPVSGSTAPARLGELIGLAGGKLTDIERARPVLERLCRRIEHMGNVGDAAVAKLAINLPLIVFWQALGEAIALLHRQGHSPQLLLQLFTESAGGANVLKQKASSVSASLSGYDATPPSFDIETMHKDLNLIMQQSEALGIATPVAKAALGALDEAVAEGFGKRDGSGVPAFWVAKQNGQSSRENTNESRRL